ncbi:MAG TPA: twin-arginine translocase subunit TatC [Candidatus Hydrogenedentes bacterium]|nr:twin-arginine translocase subunit TatC [Candidatus Hydrogenedentota bacterium]
MATIGLLNDDDKRMTFTEHLGELRTRLIRVVVVLAVAFIVCFYFSEYLFRMVQMPLIGKDIPWTTLRPMESFMVYMKLAGFGALAICFPHIVFEIAAFVFPGLKSNEKRAALFLLLGCAVLAIVGVGTGYFLVAPQLISLMMQWTPDTVQQQLQMSDTVSFVLMLLLAFAIAFQFPMVVLILVFLGVVTPDSLKQYRSIVIVLLAVAAAVLTPTVDPFSFLVMWIPLVLMYEACILISRVMARKAKE